jgi:AraC family transcriptional regulator
MAGGGPNQSAQLRVARRSGVAVVPRLRSRPAADALAGSYPEVLRAYASEGGSTPLDGPDRPQPSTSAPWQDILTVEQRRVQPFERIESHSLGHLIGMYLGAPCEVEWQIDGGRRHSATMPSRGFWLLTEGTPIWWRHRQGADVLLVALGPASIANIIGRGARQERSNHAGLIAFRDLAIEHIVLALHAELLDGCPAGRPYGEALATALVARLQVLYASAPPGDGARHGGLPSARLRRVIEHIETHLGGDTSLCKLAGLARMSPRHFAHLFKQSTGLPPHHFVLQQRIAASRRMLLQDSRPLAEIAYSLGFSSQAHFATTFRRSVGVTPGAFRKL